MIYAYLKKIILTCKKVKILFLSSISLAFKFKKAHFNKKKG